MSGLNRSREGFAVVVALLLMGFVLTLILVLSTMVKLETQVASLNRQHQKAQNNALLGLFVALGRLQELAGPDQRITARADILDNHAEILSENTHWTGVWKTREPTESLSGPALKEWSLNLDGNPALPRTSAGNWERGPQWLISSNQTPDPTQTIEQVNSMNGREYVVDLPGAEIYGDQDTTLDRRIRVGRIPIENFSGSYGFWIGDEGLKARVNLDVRTPSDLPIEEGLDAFRGAPARLLEPLDGMASLSLPDERSRWLSLAHVAIQTDFPSLPEYQFHNLTLHSRGVLANVRDGGLKKDLSHAFTSDTAFEREFMDPAYATLATLGTWSESSWRDPASGLLKASDRPDYLPSAVRLRSFPQWSILRDFYRLPIVVTDGAVPVRHPLPYFENGIFYLNTTRIPANNPITPILSRIQYLIGLETYDTTDNSGDPVRKLRLRLKTLVGLYNPYNARLEANTFRVLLGINPKIKITIDNHDPVEFYLMEVMQRLDNRTVDTALYVQLETSEAVDLLPGETRLFVTNRDIDAPDAPESYLTMEGEWSEDAPWRNLEDAQEATVEETDPNNVGFTRARAFLNGNYTGSQFGLTADEQERLTIRPGDSLIQMDITHQMLAPIELLAVTGSSPPNLAIRDTIQYIKALRRGDDFNTHVDNVDLDTLVTASSGLLPIANLNAQGFLTSWHSWLRTSRENASRNGDEPFRNLIDGNPRAMVFSYALDNFGRHTNPAGQYQPGISYQMSGPFSDGGADDGATSGPPEPQIHDDARFAAYWGGGLGFGDGAKATTLFSVPRRPPMSLADFQHANLSLTSANAAYLIGNSYANAQIPLDRTMDVQHVLHNYYLRPDFSYIFNQRLWDNYFLSTIDATMTQEDLDALRAGTASLRNDRLTWHDAPTGGAPTLDDLTDGDAPDVFSTIAGYLMQEGAFNVNSTSVESWRAILGGTFNRPVPVHELSSGRFGEWKGGDDKRAVYSRFPDAPMGEGFEPENSSDPATAERFWTSSVSLSMDQIERLAEKMVDQVKLRGPFLSLASFVNRELVNGPTGLRGALQSALDDPTVGINSEIGVNLTGITPSEYPGFFQSGNVVGPQATGYPGYVLQADVLQTLGPHMTVRSDTFRIQIYGDYIQPNTGKVLARSVGEAIVQRTVEPVQNDPNVTSKQNLANPTQAFGRKFIITSFRWIE